MQEQSIAIERSWTHRTGGGAAGRRCARDGVRSTALVAGIAGLALTTPGWAGAPCDSTWDTTIGQPGIGNAAGGYSLAVYDDGLYVGGQEFAGEVTGVGHWDGMTWQTLGSGLQGGIANSLAVYDGELVAGGRFNTAGGMSVNHIARWDGTQWSSLGTGVDDGGLFAEVSVLMPFEDGLIAGGDFDFGVDGGATAHNIARWDGATWSALGAGLDGNVRTLTVYNGELIAGGNFQFSDEKTELNSIARWDGTAWQPLGDGITDGGFNAVRALAVHEGALIVGGGFSEAGGVSASNLSRWDGSAWHAFGGGTDGAVESLIVFDGDLIIGGSFDEVDGVELNSIARWDGSFWQPMGENCPGADDVCGLNSTVRAMLEYEDQLIVTGGFTMAYGESTDRIVAWSGCATMPSICPADLAPSGGGDGVVNVFDLLELLGQWGACADADECPADLAPSGGDGQVNVFDLLELLSAWGDCPKTIACADNCEDAEVVTLRPGESHVFIGNNECATHSDCEIFDQGRGNAWIGFNLPEDSQLTISYCGSSGFWDNSWLNLATGCPCDGYNPSIGWPTNSCDDGNARIEWAFIPAGEYYYPILRDRKHGAEGDYVITVEVEEAG